MTPPKPIPRNDLCSVCAGGAVRIKCLTLFVHFCHQKQDGRSIG
ncbi:hypothetical protein ACHAWF_017983 [Thalassiosira exigua]